MSQSKNPSLKSAARTFGKIGLLSFGGPAAQISLMHRLLVDDKKWLTEQQYLNALNFCMLLPGPEAMQLATYAGWRLHGTIGGLVAGLLFVLPGAAVVLTLAILYVYFGNLPLIATLFVGIKATVLVIVIEALLKVSKRALKGRSHWLIAGGAFAAIFFFRIPFPLIILTAALYGYFSQKNIAQNSPVVMLNNANLPQFVATLLLGVLLWSLPFIFFAFVAESQILTQVGLFFSKLAVVTFGGAYAVLAYMGQDVVDKFGWLSAGEMMDGLGLAETTPGPLILVTEFVGFIAGFRSGGIITGLAGAALTLWVTFVPCFVWVFAGAPYLEWISSQPRLNSAMAAITAAVVGVILNLSVWFALHVIFQNLEYQSIGLLNIPILDMSNIDWRVPPISVLCGFFLLRLHWNITSVLVVSSLLGYALTLLL